MNIKQKDWDYEKIIGLVLDGDNDAEKELYHWCDGVVGLYLKNNWSGVRYYEDYVSEIILKVFTGLKTYNTKDSGSSKFKSWVLSIAKNHMCDVFRHSGGVKYTTIDINDITEFQTTITSDELIDNKRYVSTISDFVGMEDFDLLNMKYVMGYTYNEIGKYYNITSTTASNRVNYLKTKIKNNVEI